MSLRDQLPLWHAAAEQHRKDKKHLPVVLNIEMYEYLGEWVKITELSSRWLDADTRVVIETRFGDNATVELSELSLRKP